ncbi:MAG: hypothetical protein LH471_02665, partial [Salinibacterium sp.]|nr:hypothetical protein [Salinibacterium sp.]
MDVVAGIIIAIVTAVGVVTTAIIVGFVMLFRRKGGPGTTVRRPGARGGAVTVNSNVTALRQRAGTLLVRLDDAIRNADDELGFALAQFGPEKTQPYADAVAAARGHVSEAFRLSQALDDVEADSPREQREWTLQIIALCEKAESRLAAQDRQFQLLRASEVNASAVLAEVRAAVAAVDERRDTARGRLERLKRDFVPETFEAVVGNVDEAEKRLAAASAISDAAEPTISQSGVNSVSTDLHEATQLARQAEQLLDAIDRTAEDLATASEAVEALRISSRGAMVEAARQRDAAADPASAAAILNGMMVVDATLVDAPGRANPVADLDRIGDAVAGLDLALAGARNQAERTEHARAAYEGTHVSATSQIAVARDLIG